MALPRLSSVTFLSCLFFTFPALSQSTQEYLVGTWYSEKQEAAETMKWLTRRMADNSYATLFLVCHGENFSWVQKEIGVWQFQNDQLMETVHSIEDMNGRKPAPDHTDTTYTNLNHNGGSLSYVKLNSEKSFNFHRVDDGYQLSCQKQ